MMLRLTSFGVLILLILPDINSAGTMVRHSPFKRLRYREIPIQEALRGMSRNARARQAKQTDLHSTGTYAHLLLTQGWRNRGCSGGAQGALAPPIVWGEN